MPADRALREHCDKTPFSLRLPRASVAGSPHPPRGRAEVNRGGQGSAEVRADLGSDLWALCEKKDFAESVKYPR